ncbi:uncharacterized protein LOC111631958 [Centruroides sculpturatus]|uniref:uncharacterized protein LOC111631958 n=1 Tax=Centruroides sculpturatus TaxID=218467 RepID=UPI000C6D3B39|nr:uncharacterized protein LOC111631958 [Centruroides sculpturatus]
MRHTTSWDIQEIRQDDATPNVSSEERKKAFTNCIESYFTEDLRSASSDFSKCLNCSSLTDVLNKLCSVTYENYMEFFPVFLKCLEEIQTNEEYINLQEFPKGKTEECLQNPKAINYKK